MTLGCALIMGRKTFESLPGPLKGRYIIMMTRQPRLESKFTPDGFARDLDHALELAHATKRPVRIAGGGQIYAQALRKGVVDFIDMTVVPHVDHLLTVVPHVASRDDVLFPLSEISHGFRLEERVRNEKDCRLAHHLYVRR